MNNDELLEKMRGIVREEVTASENRVKSELRQEIKASEERLGKKIQVVTEAMAEFFHKTWEKMDETDERVTTIEDHLDLPHPVKN
jgi:hypothetical protein